MMKFDALFRGLCGGVALGCFAGAVPAAAAPITETYVFSLSQFADALGSSTPPYATTAGSFTVTFDPTVTVSNSSANLTVNAYSGAPVASSFVYSYNATSQLFSFGGSASGASLVTGGVADVVLQLFVTADGVPTLANCAQGFSCGTLTGNAAYSASAYTTAGGSTGYFAALAGSSVAAVPEPTSWGMMIAGIAVIGVAARRRRDLGRAAAV